MWAVYMSRMSWRLERLAARKTVTRRSMFWPEHHTSGMPVVLLNSSTMSPSISVSVANPVAEPVRVMVVPSIRRVLTFFGGLLGTLAYTSALSFIQYINFSVVVLLQKLQPIFAIILARVVLKEQIKGRFYLWAGLALVGSYFVAFPDVIPKWQDGGKNVWAGLLAVGAAFAWGSSTVMGKYSLRELDTKIVTPLRLGLTTILSGVYLLLFVQFDSISSISSEQLYYLIAIVFSSGAVALSIYYFGLKKVAASEATILEMFWPISAVFIDWVFFDHALTWSQIMGAMIMLTAIYRVSRRKRIIQA